MDVYQYLQHLTDIRTHLLRYHVECADVLDVSLDYLVDDNSTMLFDKQTVKRLQDIEALPQVNRDHIFYMIDNLIKAAKFKTL